MILCTNTQAAAPVSEPAKESIDQRLDRIEQVLQGQGLLNMLQQLEQLQQEIRQLRGEIETQNYNIDQLNKRQRDLYTDLDQRIQRLGNTAVTTSGATPDSALQGTDNGGPPLQTLSAATEPSLPANAAPSDNPLQVEIIATTVNRTAAGATAAGSVSPTGPSPANAVDTIQLQAEYQQAFNLLKQSLYDQAIRAFQEFLAAHPDGQYADNAQYWLGEAYYVKREFLQAVEHYNKVISDHPTSQKVDDAQLKIGFSLYELGELDAAKEQLENLINKKPDSTAARLAAERLKLVNAAIQSRTTVAN